MSTQSSTIVQRIWNCGCNILRDNAHLVVKEALNRDDIESVVAASVARAGRLRQAILKNAFEGKLL